MRRLLLSGVGAASLLTAFLVPVAAAQAAESYPAPASGSWTITGRGYGHGHGMSQWGAQSRAVAGQDYRRILADYYPGTTAATRADRTVRVQLSRLSGSEVFLASRSDAPLTVGTRTVPQGQRLRVSWDGSALVLTAFAPGWQQLWADRWTSAPTVAGAGGIWVEKLDGSGNRYAGTVSFPLTPTITPVNDIGLEDYLLGVVPRESPAWFAPEALKAQAVAARSYALSTLRAASSPYDICDTEACQVYLGVQARTAAGAVTDLQPAQSTAAVRATAGEIREHDGAAAFTQFSSSNGGWSATGSKPYLKAAEDPWSSPAGKVPQDTVAGWTAQLPVATVAKNCPAGGRPLSLSVTARDGRGEWGGRITGLLVRCTTGDAPLSGASVARFAGALKSNWWAVVPGGRTEIDAAWRGLGGDAGVLGLPVSPVHGLPQVEGSYQLFQRGSVYWSPRSGAHAVRGAIRDAFGRLGWEGSALGFPTTDEAALRVRGGAFQQFLGGSVYFSPATGAHEVRGAVRDTWASLGWEAGYLGYPVSDERALRGGAYSLFEGGSVYYSPATGARAVRGLVREAWGRTGYEDGALGYPVTNEVALRAGAFTHFQGGSVYFSPATGAHVVRGAIRDTWAGQGWEAGRLGYPTSDEYAHAGGRRSDFQGGSITWTAAGGAVVGYR